LARSWSLRSLVLSCGGYPVVIPRPISLKPSGPDALDLGLRFRALLVVEEIFTICCAMLITPCDTEDSGLIELALVEASLTAVDLGLEFLALLVVEGSSAICCAMLITPCETEDSGLIELALVDACFRLAKNSLIAIPESLRELAGDCAACDGARDGSREGAGKAPDMTHEVARCDSTPSA
jgi:hypothetical protein